MTGTVSVFGNLQLGTSAALNSVAAIEVWKGGSLDLNNTNYDAIGQVGAGILAMQPGGVEGGSIANTGGNLTQALLAVLFPSTYAYQVGGGGTGTTTVVDGALVNLDGGASVKGLTKQGSSTVVLAAPTGSSSLNTYTGSTIVNSGTLSVPSVASLATTSDIQVNGDAHGIGVLEFTGTGSLTQTIAFTGNGTVRVTTGNMISVASLNLNGTGNSAVLAGGGTLAVTGSAGVASTGGVLNITDTSTLSLPWTSTATDPGKRFIVQNTGTLLFSSNTLTSGGGGDSIGTLMPGGTLRLANGLGTLTLNRGTASGLVMGVVETDYLELGTAAFSSADKPYKIDVGNNTLQVGAPGTAILQTATITQGTALHTPLAYIQKDGTGTLEMWQPMLQPSNTAAAMNLYWIVNSGTLTATVSGGDTSLGATAPAYFALTDTQKPVITQQHLEGIEVKSGATLVWGGPQGSLPASVYGGLPAGSGDGFNSSEFILNKGATLTSVANNPLVLGYQYTPTVGPVQNYPLPITVRSDPSTTPINLGGNTDSPQRYPDDVNRHRGPERAQRRAASTSRTTSRASATAASAA